MLRGGIWVSYIGSLNTFICEFLIPQQPSGKLASAIWASGSQQSCLRPKAAGDRLVFHQIISRSDNQVFYTQAISYQLHLRNQQIFSTPRLSRCFIALAFCQQSLRFYLPHDFSLCIRSRKAIGIQGTLSHTLEITQKAANPLLGNESSSVSKEKAKFIDQLVWVLAALA